MDAKELTQKSYEQDIEIRALKVKVQELEMTVHSQEVKIKDLQYLEGAFDNLSKRLSWLEKKA